MVLIVAFGLNGSSADANPMAGAYQKFDTVGNDEIKALLDKYYTAYASDDMATLEAVAHPISDAEKSYIEALSAYIDEYTCDEIYTKRGVSDGAYLVSAKVNIRFTGVESAAPGLDFFYVEPDENGELFINNLYSAYNQENGELEVDSTIAALIAEFEQQDDEQALQAEVQKEFNELAIKDADFNTFVTVTLPEAMQQWSTDYKTALAQAEAEAKAAEEAAAQAEAEALAQAEEEAKAAEEAAAQAEADAEAEANAVMVHTTATVNVRTDADKDSQSLGKVSEGTEIKKYAEFGEWAQVDYNGKKGYIRLDYLTSGEDDNDTAADTGANTYSAGDKVKLSGTVNMRSGMSQSSSKVEVLYSGDEVEVVAQYSEGWTKVKHKSKEGYIKTEYLK